MHTYYKIGLLGLLTMVVAMALFFTGTYQWGLPYDSDGNLIPAIVKLRLYRLAMACVVGVALSVSGVGLQVLLRNPLAEPFILGLSTGAGLGVLIQQMFIATPLPTYYGALLGAFGSLAIVYLAGRRQGQIDPLGLLLVGVVLSTISGSLILLLNTTAGDSTQIADLSRWMAGYLNEWVGSGVLILIATITFVCLAFLWSRGRALDIAGFSDEEALSLGVHMGKLRLQLFLISGMLAASAVVLAGPIAFVGLICPHIARIILGSHHRPLLLGSSLLGATLLMLAQWTSNALHLTFHWGLVPLGIFTSILGGLTFLWILRSTTTKHP